MRRNFPTAHDPPPSHWRFRRHGYDGAVLPEVNGPWRGFFRNRPDRPGRVPPRQIPVRRESGRPPASPGDQPAHRIAIPTGRHAPALLEVLFPPRLRERLETCVSTLVSRRYASRRAHCHPAPSRLPIHRRAPPRANDGLDSQAAVPRLHEHLDASILTRVLPARASLPPPRRLRCASTRMISKHPPQGNAPLPRQQCAGSPSRP